MDANNAFNSLSRVAALWNARVLWPRCSRYLFNCYRGQAIQVVLGAQEHVLSREGVTQVDTLSMLMYAVAVFPLIQALEDHSKWSQSWHADDSACAAKMQKTYVNSLTNCLSWGLSLVTTPNQKECTCNTQEQGRSQTSIQ